MKMRVRMSEGPRAVLRFTMGGGKKEGNKIF